MRNVLASMTDGMANTIMNDVTTIAQTNRGMRASVMPGARILKAVVIIWMAPISAEISVKVMSCAQKSLRLPALNSGPESGT